MVQLDYRDSRPIYTQIVDGFHEQIAAGILRPGDRLPSVRELAAALSINPNTIQRAYRRMEAESWIATVPGKGCFVCAGDWLQKQERQRWLEAFDEAVQTLETLGITRRELRQRLGEGEK